MYQAKVFASLLGASKTNTAVQFYNYEGRGTAGHIVPFVGEGGERAACEISMLASEPVMLEDVRGRANAKEIPTLPLPPEGDRRLRYFWLPQAETLHIQLLCGHFAGMLHHRIATDSPIQIPNVPHPIDSFMCAQPRGELKLQALGADASKTTVKMNTLSGAMLIRRVGGEEVRSDMRCFDAELARVAAELGATRAQLLEFFHEGLAMERELQGLE